MKENEWLGREYWEYLLKKYSNTLESFIRMGNKYLVARESLNNCLLQPKQALRLHFKSFLIWHYISPIRKTTIDNIQKIIEIIYNYEPNDQQLEKLKKELKKTSSEELDKFKQRMNDIFSQELSDIFKEPLDEFKQQLDNAFSQGLKTQLKNIFKQRLEKLIKAFFDNPGEELEKIDDENEAYNNFKIEVISKIKGKSQQDLSSLVTELLEKQDEYKCINDKIKKLMLPTNPYSEDNESFLNDSKKIEKLKDFVKENPKENLNIDYEFQPISTILSDENLTKKNCEKFLGQILKAQYKYLQDFLSNLNLEAEDDQTIADLTIYYEPSKYTETDEKNSIWNEIFIATKSIPILKKLLQSENCQENDLDLLMKEIQNHLKNPPNITKTSQGMGLFKPVLGLPVALNSSSSRYKCN